MPRLRTSSSLPAGVLAGIALAACGSGTAAGTTPATPLYVSLTITTNDGRGHVQTARLTCRPTTTTATGYLRLKAPAACARARALAAFFAAPPAADRICTQVYGGPDTARMTGLVGSRRIDRRFTRRDGCEIADWRRAGILLPTPSGLRVSGAPR